MRAPEGGLSLLGGPRRPQRKPRASGPGGSEAGAPLCAACAPPAPGVALLGTVRAWRGIVPFTHLAREGRMTVTIGLSHARRCGCMAARGAGAAAARACAAHRGADARYVRN